MSPTRRGRGKDQARASRHDDAASSSSSSSSRGASAQQSSASGSSNQDAPPFEMPGYVWDPVQKRFFKKNQGAEAAAALTNPDTRPHRYSRIDDRSRITTQPADGGAGALQDGGDGHEEESGGTQPQLHANLGRWAGGSGSHFQALHHLRTGGGQHRGGLAQFTRTTSEQFANKLRSSAVYYFTYLNNSWGAPHMHCLCSAPDGTYWAGFNNNIFCATFASHPVPRRGEVRGDVYGPPESLDEWKGHVRCLPYDRPDDTLKRIIQGPLSWVAYGESPDQLGFGGRHTVDRIDLIQGRLSTTLAPTRIFLESNYRSIVDPSTAQVRTWRPSITKAAFDIPIADMRRSSIRTAPWCGREVRASASGNFIQVLTTHPDARPHDSSSILVQRLDAHLPPLSVLPPQDPYEPIRWLVDLPALVVSSDPMAVEISMDCQWIVAGLRNGAVLLWDLKSMIFEWEDQRMTDEGPALDSYRPGSTSTLRIGSNRAIPRPLGLMPTEVMATGPGRVHHIAMASDSEFLVVFSSGEIYMFRFGSLNEGVIRSFTGHRPSDEPLGFAVHHKRRIFAAAGSDGRVRIWSLDDPNPIEPVDGEGGGSGSGPAPRRRISSREEMSTFGSSFFAKSQTTAEGTEAEADEDENEDDADDAVETWWADSSTMTVVEGEDTFVAGKAVHQVVFPSPPRTLAWVHRPVRDEFAPSTEQLVREQLNDASVDEPEVPALAVGCHNVLWFFT
ncbi:hypothetical protein A4X06_0g1299 [Tilletia controversa]|uniref:WD40 repeat-like protein n=1 Tax=Tilletia controversa TaxID=13291 RepID=A0A8X7MYM4_9BASI|nr:hypothetical protein CF328_g959 [Tilletia controversa]KAE8253659.1 hypothetical protein A4X06_0g1299 [Tilletia controversa]